MVVVGGALLAWACGAQQFEIASVKANTNDSRTGSVEFSADLLTARNTYLGVLIQRAYGLDEMQLPKASAVPVMLAKYDVDAKAPHAVKRSELLAMLRNLLTDRFKLSFHWETKEVGGYVLTAAKEGPHMQPHSGDPDGDCKTRRLPDGALHYENCSMAEFASMRMYSSMAGLGGLLGVAVVEDQTGLQGKFDFDLMASWEAGGDGANRRIVNPEAPSIFTALQKQLGLKLESRWIAARYFQIDHLEKASEN
jgi:uncharacterized protein (TIGR03435 family)